MTTKSILRILLLAVILLITAFVLFRISKARTFQFFGQIIPWIKTQEKVVALTFDDGPTEKTDEILATLKEKKVKATFYLIGNNLEKKPKEGKKIAENGHEIGNHSYSHTRMVLKTPAFVKNEIEKTDRLIKETGYQGEIHFRPPFGKKLFVLPWYLMQHDRQTIMWDIEPETYPEVGKSAERIVEHVMSRVKPGSIILLHPMNEPNIETRKALPMIIDELKNQGYTFVTVSDLLRYQ